MNKNYTNQDPRVVAITTYKTARLSILLIALATVINIVLLLANTNTYIVLSAYIPYFLLGNAMFLCGMFPPAYYEEMGDMTFLAPSLFVFCLILSCLIIAAYVVCWAFAKRESVWPVAIALGLFAVDTAGVLLFEGLVATSILGILFRAWAIYELVTAILAAKRLRKMPEEIMVIEGEGGCPAQGPATPGEEAPAPAEEAEKTEE